MAKDLLVKQQRFQTIVSCSQMLDQTEVSTKIMRSCEGAVSESAEVVSQSLRDWLSGGHSL
jgi:hypothetical protein